MSAPNETADQRELRRLERGFILALAVIIGWPFFILCARWSVVG